MNRLTQSLLLVAASCVTVLNCQSSRAQSEPSYPYREPDSFQIESIDPQPAQSAYYQVGDQESEHEKISRCEQQSAVRTSFFSYLPFVGRFFDNSSDSEACPCELPILSRQVTWQAPGQPQTEPQIEVTVQQPRAAALRALLTKRAVHNRELIKISGEEQNPNASAPLAALRSNNSCRCSQGGPCEAGLHVPDGGVVLIGGKIRIATDANPTPSFNCIDSRCVDACCAEAKTCAACETISECKCQGECKCCDASRGENCACSNCGCGKKASSKCKCEGKCSCGSGSRGNDCACDNCRCANDAGSSKQLLALCQKIDSPEDLSAFITHVVKKYASSPYRDEADEQAAEALIALATENFKMHVQMLVHGHDLQSAEKINELRQQMMGAQMENVRLQAQLEGSEKLLELVGEIYENPRNYSVQPFYSPQVINAPTRIDGWQAPVRLATPQTLPAGPNPHYQPYQPVYPQPAMPPTQILPPPTVGLGQPCPPVGPPVNTAIPCPQCPPARQDSNIPSNHPGYGQPSFFQPDHGASNSPQLQNRIEQLEREIAQLRESRSAPANCLPRPTYPLTQFEPAQISTPAVDNSPSTEKAVTMTVTPRIIIQEEEEEVLVIPSIGR